MKRILLSLFSLLALVAKADEGMWMVGNISARTDSVLQSLGLRITPDEIYSADRPSLNDAIVMFGGFCSGVVVSPDGLVFTNHHCGFDAIQQHSTVRHDYLKNGFYAKKLKDELPNPELYVAFHLGTVDVTDKLLAGTEDMGPVLKTLHIDSVAMCLQEEVLDTINRVYGEITPYYKGSKYYLSVYQRYDDIRLVCAPPQSLGKFGGDTDNWMWPRQTCDFSVFRIYAGKDNQPADYSKDNVPYHPKRYAHVSAQGYQPGSFCMTFGYPGSTDRYLSSYGIENTMKTTNHLRYEVRTVKLDILKEAMQKDDNTRIMYASKYAASSNYWKFSLGQNNALKNLNVIKEKRDLENEVKEWAKANGKTQYEGILDSLKVLYERDFQYNYTTELLQESFATGSDILAFCLSQLVRQLSDDGQEKESLQKKIADTYKDIDIELDRKVFAAMIKNYRKMSVSKDFEPDFYNEIDEKYNGDIDAYTEHIYAESKLTDRERLASLQSYQDLSADPLFEVAYSVLSKAYTLYRQNNINEYERLLGDAVREMNKDREYYPDANFTLRMSYGIVEGYSPSAGLNYVCYTLPQSLLDKNGQNPENHDYDLIPSVLKWLRKGDFGDRYKDKTIGQMPLCFLTNNDITGGNSGSGMFDGNGRLIGLAFDGNWEAMSGDLKFDNRLQRTIGVDIRYVLSVIEKYCKGKRIINELTIE